MAYRRLALSTLSPSLPGSVMVPLQPLEPAGPHAAMRALDTLPRSTRVLAHVGFDAATDFIVPDGDNPATLAAPRIYPDATTPRVVLRLSGVRVTPGHVIGLDVLALPGGPTQWSPETGEYAESGRGGSVQMSVTYSRTPASTTASCSVSPPGSAQIYGAIPASAIDSITEHHATALPWAGVPSAADLETWGGGGVLADIVVSETGSPRVLDCAVVERPRQICVNTASATWPAAMYTQTGVPLAELPSDYPITQLATADPGGGLEGLRRAVEQAGVQLGPALMWWSSSRQVADTLDDWISYDGGSGDDEAPAHSTTSTTFRWLPLPSAALAMSTLLPLIPGHQLGGYARQSSASDEWLDGRTGVFPVVLAVYGYGDEGTGIVQAQAGPTEWSAVSVAAPAGGPAWGWWLTAGWMEVGTSPEDGPVGHFVLRESAGGTVSVRYAAVFHRQT